MIESVIFSLENTSIVPKLTLNLLIFRYPVLFFSVFPPYLITNQTPKNNDYVNGLGNDYTNGFGNDYVNG
jgi:hypothetical protein